MGRSLSILIVAALVAAACGGAGVEPTTATVPLGEPSTAPPASRTEPGGEVREVQADVPRADQPHITDDELAALVACDTAFAFDLYHQAAGDTNLVFSPSSIAAALTMTYAGARGDTAAEMRDVLHLGLDDDRIHPARNELDLRLTGLPVRPPGPNREPFTIRAANSLWGQQGYPFREDFLSLLAEHYGAGMNLVDFVSAPDDARRTINAWVERETEGRITGLLPDGAVDDLTRLVLVNAIWFAANWEAPFGPDQTTDGTFTTLDGDEVTVPMMQGALRTRYTDGDGYVAVELLYAGDASMLLLVPDPGRFADVAARFGPDLLAEIDRDLSVYDVDLAMPRFEFGSRLGLVETLKALGMVAAFRDPSRPDGADFTGMTPRRELLVTAVVHQAFISVDEEGTEASAATAVVMGLQSLVPSATVSLDRPFLYLIRHDPTGEILFLGQVTDPSGSPSG